MPLSEYLSVTVIIVTRNSSGFIRTCIESLKSSTVSVKIIIVDNESSDSTVSIIREYEDIKLVCLSKNIGFGQANNIGLHIALRNETNFAFLLNQDAHINSNTLDILIDLARNRTDYGILSPLHLTADEKTLDPNFAGYIFHGASQYFSDLRLGEVKDIYPVEFVNAAAWLISFACIKAIGGFDPAFFMYCEDDDYCRRSLQHDYKIGFVPEAAIIHSRTSGVEKYSNPWTRRSVNLERMSSREKSKHILSLKDPSRPFLKILASISIKTLHNIVQALLDLKWHYAVSVLLGFIRLVKDLPIIWRHRQKSLHVGSNWLDDDSINRILRYTAEQELGC